MVDRNTRIRFMANNHGEVASASITASSAASGFPVTNAINAMRSKVYKPAGNFEITSSNCKVYINDGSDKTVTLSTGNYTYATLASHIQTELNASSSGWTVAYDYNGGTYKFTITRSSSATLRFTVTTDAAWDTLGYATTANETGTSFVADAQRNHTSETITWDLGTATPITFFAAIGPINETFSVSENATLRLYGNNSNTWGSPALSVTLTADDYGIFKFLDDLADYTYRYWRFELIDKTNPVGPDGFKLSHVYLGDYVTLTTRNVANGFSRKWVDPSVRVESENGALFVQSKTKYLKFDSVNVQYISSTERADLEQLFYDNGIGVPFYVSFDPTLLVSSALSDYTKYVMFDEEPTLRHVKNEYYNISMSMREAL
jgi:hypothetical protein